MRLIQIYPVRARIVTLGCSLVVVLGAAAGASAATHPRHSASRHAKVVRTSSKDNSPDTPGAKDDSVDRTSSKDNSSQDRRRSQDHSSSNQRDDTSNPAAQDG